MSDTKEKILDTMQALIQTRGFSAVSYQDIAAELNIRKASIHYHFATKNELGVAVVERYGSTFTDTLRSANESGYDAWRLLDTYCQPFVAFGNTADKICLCGALAGEFPALPEQMQVVVKEFFENQQQWLEKLLRKGRANNEFGFAGPARRQARLVFSALQGALILKRSNGDYGQIRDVITEIKARLKPS